MKSSMCSWYFCSDLNSCWNQSSLWLEILACWHCLLTALVLKWSSKNHVVITNVEISDAGRGCNSRFITVDDKEWCKLTNDGLQLVNDWWSMINPSSWPGYFTNCSTQHFCCLVIHGATNLAILVSAMLGSWCHRSTAAKTSHPAAIHKHIRIDACSWI